MDTFQARLDMQCEQIRDLRDEMNAVWNAFHDTNDTISLLQQENASLREENKRLVTTFQSINNELLERMGRKILEEEE